MEHKLNQDEVIRNLATSENALERVKSRLLSRIEGIEQGLRKPDEDSFLMGFYQQEIARIGGLKAAIEEVDNELEMDVYWRRMEAYRDELTRDLFDPVKAVVMETTKREQRHA